MYVPVPPVVTEALDDLRKSHLATGSAERTTNDYCYFWPGGGVHKTAIELLRKKVIALAEVAGVADMRFHRLRDTFAVDLLLHGVSLEGRSSIVTTVRGPDWEKGPVRSQGCVPILMATAASRGTSAARRSHVDHVICEKGQDGSKTATSVF